MKFETLVSWLASRQTSDLGEDEGEEGEDDGDTQKEGPTPASTSGSLEDQASTLPYITPIAGDTIPCAGFNGRCNKVADTCYSFWNGATLKVRVPHGTKQRSLIEEVDAGPILCD